MSDSGYSDNTPPPARDVSPADLANANGSDELMVPGGATDYDGTNPSNSEYDGTEADEENSDLNEEITKDVEESEGDDDEESEKNWLLPILCCLICCLLVIGLLVLLWFLFKVDDMGAARAQLDPSTDSPTFIIETDSPTPLVTGNPTLEPTTESPTTDSPTITEVTGSPTPAPTLPPTRLSGEKSRLPCNEIKLAAASNEFGTNFGDNNFKLEPLLNGTMVCGDTYGPDPEKPNRNAWSVRIGRRDCPMYTYDEGFEVCDLVGARWCTVDEFIAQVAHGTGCGGDREFVYTNTDCFDVENNLAGKIMFDVGLRDQRRPFFFCESDLSRPSLARCCGDVVV